MWAIQLDTQFALSSRIERQLKTRSHRALLQLAARADATPPSDATCLTITTSMWLQLPVASLGSTLLAPHHLLQPALSSSPPSSGFRHRAGGQLQTDSALLAQFMLSRRGSSVTAKAMRQMAASRRRSRRKGRRCGGDDGGDDDDIFGGGGFGGGDDFTPGSGGWDEWSHLHLQTAWMVQVLAAVALLQSLHQLLLRTAGALQLPRPDKVEAA